VWAQLAGLGAAWALVAMAGDARTRVLGLPAPGERLVARSLGTRDGRLFLIATWEVLGQPLVGFVAFFAAWVLSIAMRLVLVRRSFGLETPAA
jgi:hypothetical protein